MPREDFTTYTEVDTANNRIQRTATHVDHAATRNEDTYLYADKGAGFFTNFEHWVDVRSDFLTASGSGVLYMLSEAVDDRVGLKNASKTYIGVTVYNAAGVYRIYALEGYAGSEYVSYTTISANTWYYLVITKSGTSYQVKVYTDSARTSLLATLSLTLHADHVLRYVFACNTENDGAGTFLMNDDIDNLNLSPKQYVTVTESLGILDSAARRADYKQTVSEILGPVDSAVRQLAMKLAVSEVLGMRDGVEARKHVGRLGDLPDHYREGGA